MPGFFKGYHTETAGTAIVEVIEPVEGKVAKIESIVYEAAGTAHTLTFVKALAVTKTTAATADGGTVLVLENSSPGFTAAGLSEILAGSDYVIYKDQHGGYYADTVASVSNDEVTLDNATTYLVDAGAPVWAMYEVGRAAQVDTINVKLNTTIEYSGLSIVSNLRATDDIYNNHDGVNMPIMFYSDNATNAGFLRQLSGVYVDP